MRPAFALLGLGLAHCNATDKGAEDTLLGDSGSADDSGSVLLVDAARPDATVLGDDARVGDDTLGYGGATDSGAMPSFTASRIASPPTYVGTTGGSDACTQSFRTLGYAPADTSGGKHALFLYFAGTAVMAADPSAKFDSQAADRVTQAMAERGFVALSAEYDNQLGSFFTNKQPCLFGSANAASLIARACALPSVDCSLGIATWGHSQGGLLAHAAGNFDTRVRAVWTTGYSGLSGAKLSFNRFRTVNGEADTANAAVDTANKTAGFTSADACPDDGRDQCLRDDGSGWIIVRKSACKLSAADHCWFNKASCTSSGESLEPNWLDPSSTTPFALAENADWVARTVARP